MAAPALKLGTRRSALARAQSAQVARLLEHTHPGLKVELVGIDTRGDRIQDRPLTAVDGKEFFTAEIDAALLAERVDFTVHSYKDLSLERNDALYLAAVPQRQPPFDLVLFAPDVRARLAAGEVLRIGSSSPRRASFVPELLARVLPQAAAPARVELVELRGNVDSRVRRLHETRGSARHLDGVVLAFAGLNRLWADAAGQQLLASLLPPLPRMLLPLSYCPAAPAQGALAIECRSADADTRRLLAAIDHAPSRAAVAAERRLLGLRGGGCQQRFGATQIAVTGLGALLYEREASDSAVAAPQLQWTPEPALPPPPPSVRAWDGTRVAAAPAEALLSAGELSQALAATRALFITHRRALIDGTRLPAPAHIWVPGVETWRALAARDVWVEGCADGLGFESLQSLLSQPVLQLPPSSQWSVLTHEGARDAWPQVRLLASYRHVDSASTTEARVAAPDEHTTHVYWSSGAQFERWQAPLSATVQHACGPGRTFEHLQRAGVQNLRMFPQVAHWRAWLGQ